MTYIRGLMVLWFLHSKDFLTNTALPPTITGFKTHFSSTPFNGAQHPGLSWHQFHCSLILLAHLITKLPRKQVICAGSRLPTHVCHDGAAGTWTHSTKGLWAHNWNLVVVISAVNYNFNYPISLQICTCHNSSAVVTCAKLWTDWIIIFQERATWFFQDLDYELINLCEMGLWCCESPGDREQPWLWKKVIIIW